MSRPDGPFARRSASIRAAAALTAVAVALVAGHPTLGAQEAATGPVTYRELAALFATYDRNPAAVVARVNGMVLRRPCARALTAAQWAELERLGPPRRVVDPLRQKCGTRTAPLGESLDDDQFVTVAPGTFSMGSARYDSTEGPVRVVRLTRPFRLQKTEVTQAQWERVMDRNPSRFRACGPTCPVENVTWDDVQEFLRRLNQREPGRHYRLPTEAEWEYAARAATPADWDYAGPGPVEQLGWTSSNSGQQTHPAGQLAANAWGLYDMHGNVWEWVADWWDPTAYARMPVVDPPGPPSGEFHVLRGGSWRFPSLYARSASRQFVPGAPSKGDVGFRLVRDR